MKNLLISSILLICLSLIDSSNLSAQQTGRSLHFDGVNDYVSGIPTNGYNEFTFEAWIKWEGNRNWERVFDFAPYNAHGNSTTDLTHAYLMFTPQSNRPGGQALLQMRFNNVDNDLLAPKLTNTWTHVVITLDANKVASIYYDGVLQSSKTFSHTYGQLSPNYNWLGWSQFPQDPLFKGYMDDVRLWNDVRTSTEIMEWKDCELSGTEDNLSTYFKMDQGLAGGTNPNTGVYHPHYAPVPNTGDGETEHGHAHNFAMSGTQSNWQANTGLSVTNAQRNCIEFDGLTNSNGSYDFFTLTNEQNFDFAEEYTIEFWYYPNESTSYKLPVIKQDGNNINYYIDQIDNRLFHGNRFNQSSSHWVETPNAFIADDNWHHVAIVGHKTSSGLIKETYIDGVLRGSNLIGYSTFPLNNAAVILGRNLNGKMSNIRFWNKQRTGNSIKDNMSTVYASGTEGLVAQYVQFQDISQGLLDSIGGNHGTRGGTPAFASDPCFVLFNQQPQDYKLLASNSPVTFIASVVHCNDANFTYQWLKDGIAIPGATDLSYTNPSATQADLGEYSLQVTACNRVFISKKAVLSIVNQGSVLHFDGKDDYFKWNGAIGVSDDYTIETFVKFDNDPVNQTIITMTDAQGLDELATYQIIVNKNGHFQHNTLADGMRSVIHPQDLLANTWYHVAASVSGGKLLLKVDGVPARQPQESVNVQAPTQGNQFFVGHPACGFGAFAGEMEELRIWNTLANTRNDSVVSPLAPGLTYYFQFNNGLANLANDNPPVNTMLDAVDGSSVVADLFNFSLNGNTSNWLNCGPFATDIIISQLPQNAELIEGEMLTLDMTVDGINGTESYQWYRNNEILINETNASLIKDEVQPSDAGTYHVIINRLNSCSATSASAEVLVKGTGQVLNFDGIDDYMVVNNIFIQDPYTIELWVKFEGSVANKNIIQGSDDQGPMIYAQSQLYTDANGVITHYAYNLFDGHITQPSTVTAELDRWYHIAIRGWEGSGLQILIDGIEVQAASMSFNQSPPSSTTKFFIGAQGHSNPSGNYLALDNFQGEIDELRIWQSYRTNTEILDHINNEVNFLLPGYVDLKGYYKFNRGDANENNSEFRLDEIPDYKSIFDYEYGNAELFNFDLQGPESNYSDCSPVQRPNLNPGNNAFAYLFDSDFTLEVFDTKNNSGLTYQWSFDSVAINGETNSTLEIDKFAFEDAGTYIVEVKDGCDPQFIGTLNYPIDTICLGNIGTFQYTYIDYPTASTYTQDSLETFTVGNLVGPWCDNGIVYGGNAGLFKWTITEPSFAKITLSNLDSEADLIVISGGCSATNCAGSSLNPGLQDEYIQTDLGIGDHYILISGLDDQVFNYNFQLDLELLSSKCLNATAINCGDIVSGITAGTDMYIEEYCETTNNYSGPEKIYSITLSEPQTLTIDLTNLDADLDLFLMDSTCSDMICLGSSISADQSDEQVIYGANAGTYYIAVDGKAGATGSFDLAVDCQSYFTASVLDNDAYIDLNWAIDKKLCVPQDTGIIVRLIAAPSDILFEQEFNTAAATPDVIAGNFKDYVGVSQTKSYVLRVFNRLTNQAICAEIKTGSTSAFYPPELISVTQGTEPDSIQLVWRNNSKLSDIFRIYRDGNLISILNDGYTEDSLIVTYVDGHDINDQNSIQTNATYNYCIETFSTQLNLPYQQVCGNGSTQDIDFTASDYSFADSIQLQWNDISSHCTSIKLERNGILLATLNPSSTTFTDISPIYGVNSSYSLTLMRGQVEVMEVFDDGIVNPHGHISGTVSSKEEKYPVKGVIVSLSKDTLIGGQSMLTQIASTSSNFEGKYSFDNIVYGLSTTFTVSVLKTGSTFTETEQTATLNEAIPSLNNIHFIEETELNTTLSTALIDSFYGESKILEDLVVLNWDYSYSTSDTTFFKIFREGDLIHQTNDASGAINSFTDLTGVPGLLYTYTLEAFRFEPTTIQHQQLAIDVTFPTLTALTELQITTGDSMNPDPRVYFTWGNVAHPSLNFDGYRIFQNGNLIGEVDKNTEQYSFVAIPDLTAGYSIKAFRNTSSASHESLPYPIGDTLVKSGPLFTPELDTFLTNNVSKRTIYLESSFFSGNGDFYENGFYEGILYERKLQGESNDSFQIIGDLTKAFAASQVGGQIGVAFYDETGIPGIAYDYRVSIYITIDGVIHRNSLVDARICPDIVSPSNIVTNEAIGKVSFTWDDESSFSNQISLRYINYHGIEVFRRDSTNNTILASIADLPANAKNYNNYVQNPVFDIFYNQYTEIQYHYAIKSYLIIDGQRYYSPENIISAKPLSGSTIEPIPTNFVASKDIPGHIKLCWEWQPAKQSQFIIFRDSVALDTLPHTARAYYDYDAPTDPTVSYFIASYFGNNVSDKAGAEGYMPSFAKISGRVYNQYDGSGLEGITIYYINITSAGFPYETFTDFTTTDVNGRYTFAEIPNYNGLKLLFTASGDDVDFNSDPFIYQVFDSELMTLNGSNNYTLDFIDYQDSKATDKLAAIKAVKAVPSAKDFNVTIEWTPTDSNYQGVEVYRINKRLALIPKGQTFSFKDTTGFGGIVYSYGVRTYRDVNGQREYSPIKSVGAEFPTIAAVNNLTATGFFNENKMLIAWSHQYDNHDVYRVRRNGEFLAVIPTGSQMMFYDTTGAPGQTYQYEIVAIKGNLISLPTVVIIPYKGVGEVKNLQVSIDENVQACSYATTNGNYVNISWEYLSNSAQGFEIYRDGELIAELDSTLLAFGNLPLRKGDVLMTGNAAHYLDYSGTPGASHTYHVLAYVERLDERYTSGIEELFLTATIIFPELAQVAALDIEQNNVLGSVQVKFDYPPYIASGFEILRDGVAIDTILDINAGAYIYQDFEGLPAQTYTYAVRTFDRRQGIAYFSSTVCDETIQFPIVPVPQNFRASQGDYLNHIEVRWDFSSEAFIDSFYVENLTLNTTTLYSGGRRIHTDVINNIQFDKHQYRIRASRILNGTTIYSDWSDIADGWSQKQINGSDNETFEKDCFTQNLGFSVDIDGDWAVATTASGSESFNIYKRNAGGWSLFETIESQKYTNSQFGFSAAISGNRIVIGVPNADEVYIYEFNGVSWKYPTRISENLSTNYGWAVDIDGDHIVIGAPGTTFTSPGEVFFYSFINNHFQKVAQHTRASSYRLGYGVAISGDQAVASYVQLLSSDEYDNSLMFRNDAGCPNPWDCITTGDANWREIDFTPEMLRDNVDLVDNKLIVGYPSATNTSRRAKIAELNVGVLSNQVILNPAVATTFGTSVAIAEIPSPINNVTYAIISDPLKDIGGKIDAGNARLYSNQSGSFQEIEIYQAGDLDDYDYFGHSVGISKDAIMIGAIGAGIQDQGLVKIFNLIEAPSLVSATDGISIDNDPTETTVYWEFKGDENLVNGFNIYRGDEFLIFRNITTTQAVAPNTIGGSWNDNSGNPGERYVYSVRTTNTLSGFESPGTSDQGYNAPDGIIQGSVVTAQGGIAVPGVLIKATGQVNGEIFTYETTTISNGEYILDDVFYDSNPNIATTYQVEAEFEDHIIIAQNNGIATLNSVNDPVAALVNFYDNSVYVIAGQVIQPLVNCPVEGIKITPIINGIQDLFGQATTDEEGRYSIIINPNDPSMTELKIRIDNKITGMNESFQYGFTATGDTVFTNFINFAFETELNFVDQLSYPISLKVKNTCNDAIASTRWNVRIRTTDGCFDEIYQTNLNGDLNVDLFPLNYTMKVVGADNASSQISKALDYFANFPVKLALEELHRDSIETMTFQEITDASARQFTYHVAPTIEVSGFSNYFCNTPAVIIQQGESYTMSFDISEFHNGSSCDVHEGNIKINNPAAGDQLNTFITYDPLTESFPDYTFIAGAPNQISPHFYAVTIDYVSDENVFLGRKFLAVFVEGSVTLDGSDIQVDPGNGDDNVPYPLMVLRDPPGDGSSSYIAGGQSIEYNTTASKAFGGEVNIYMKTGVDIGDVTTNFGTSFTTGGSDEYNQEWTNELTVSQTISTADDETNIGEAADIVVGTGLVMSYGYVIDFKVQNCDEILREVKYVINPDAATTTWFYTVGQINDIITGYINDSLKIELGTLKLEEFGEVLPLEKAREKVHTRISNWKQVLRYHNKETKPHFAICARSPKLNGGFLNPTGLQKTQIDAWKSKVCPLLGTGVDETFELHDDIAWSDPVMDMYNASSIAIRNIADGNNGSGLYTYPANDNIHSLLNHPDVASYMGTFGAPVKNVTVGGAVSIEESFANVNSSSRTHTSNFYLSSELSASVGYDTEVTLFAGLFAGVGGIGAVFGGLGGIIETVGSFTLEAGISGEFNFNMSNSSAVALTNEIETGYTLFDDDNIDQFSVAIIQPISQDQTAYFDYFGGRSSCPPEEGSIFADNPKIAILNPTIGATSPTKELLNVPADEAATFIVIVENQTPVPSQPGRLLQLSIKAGSNDNGAIVTLNGVSLNNGIYVDSFPAFEPDTMILTLERGPNFYEYSDIKIGVEPTCGFGPVEFIEVTAKFVNPCSPVTLIAPNNNWIRNDDTTKLTIAMQDYDPTNNFLVDATVQYRRLGADPAWFDIDPIELELGNYITPAKLAGNDTTYLPGQTPKYYFTWTIPTDEGLYPDGDYEVRVLMQCNNFTRTISNSIKGKISRDGLKLFGLPQPSDKLWTNGDEISFTFNKDLDCALISSPFISENISLRNITTDSLVDFNVSCYANKLIFTLANPMSTYDGQFLKMEVNGIPSLPGNISEKLSWTFRVITQKVYWANPDTVKIRLYQGEVVSVVERLENNTTSETLTLLNMTARDGNLDDWISVLIPVNTNFSLTPAGRPVTFEIDASQPVGIYNETIEVNGVDAFGRKPILHVELEVLVTPPIWVVNPNEFEHSMNMVSNWRFTTDTVGAKSQDQRDLISAWIDGEIRGVVPISEVGEFNAAFMTIYGRSSDEMNPLIEFRIWDADSGIEYNGYPTDSIFYVINTIRGTTGNPEMLLVDSLTDAARYTYLNDGWTGFSLPTTTNNMNVNAVLQSLQHVTNGDILVTNNKFSMYSDSLSWFNFGDASLNSFDNNAGYMIYLENGPDTLRTTGEFIAPAAVPDIMLQSGWNWIGFPFENAENINQAFNINTANSTGNDLIKLDFPLPGESPKFAQYDIVNDNWNNGNIGNMESNNLYKLFSGHPNGAMFSWDPQNNLNPPPATSSRSGFLADPTDASTWLPPKLNTDLVMPVIAEVIVDSTIVTNINDRVAFFENDTLRGLGDIAFVPETGQYAISFITERSQGNFDIRYYDSSADTVLKASNSLGFDIAGVGVISDPYEIRFDGDPCLDHLVLTLANSPLNGLYEARVSITVNGPVVINLGDAVILNAPEVLMSDFENVLGSDLEITQSGCGE